MLRHKPTGRTRHRILTRLFREPVLVLQHEMAGQTITNNGGIIDSEDVVYWVDTQPEDVLTKAAEG